MFASLKSKIKEETGSDISKLTTSWRSGAFLGRLGQRDDTDSPSSSGGHGDSNSESISPQLETYLKERTGGVVDQSQLHQEYAAQLEERLRERDAMWETRVQELKASLSSIQGEEAVAAQAVARAAQAEAVAAGAARAAAERQLLELRERVTAELHAQDRLDALSEELDSARREWGQERAEMRAALGAAEARVHSLSDELALVRAALPPSHPHHHFHEGDVEHKTEEPGCEGHERLRREHAVLSRQLQEAKLALADVKTSWSGQIATLETQEKVMELERRLEAVLEENAELSKVLEDERTLVRILQEKVETSEKQCAEKQTEVMNLTTLFSELQHDYVSIQRKYEKEKREKDDALLRNAHMSQSIQLNQCDIRDRETELTDMKAKITELETLVAQHRENQAACMLIKENELSKLNDIEKLTKQVEDLANSENELKSTIQNLETQLGEKNKKIKTLDTRISDMKKTLQRELQSSKSEVSCAEDADISRRYLKHVVMRFLTARELEARQLTRALSTLLRLSAQEEALLQAALPPRSGLAGWLANLSPT